MAKTLAALAESTPFQRAIISIFDRPIDPGNPDPEPAHVKDYDYRGLREDLDSSSP